MFCALSGEVPENPCVTKEGHVYERRLIEKYIRENATCPVTKQPLSVDDLIPLKTNKFVKPRAPSATSIPSLLNLFQLEWDALVLETYHLKEQLETTRQELAHALYQNDAACRVIARLIRERDQARESMTGQAPAKDIEMEEVEELAPAPVEKVSATLPLETLKAIDAKASVLTQARRNRVIPDETSKSDDFSGFNLKKELSGHGGRNASVLCFDLNEQIVVSGGSDKNLHVLNIDGEVLNTLKGHTKKITSCRISQSAIVSASEDKTIRIWDLSSYECPHVVKCDAPVSDLAIHPISSLAISSLQNGQFLVLNLETGEELLSVDTNEPLTAVSIHPDGLLFALASENSIKIWDIKRMEQVAEFKDGHTDKINSLSFSENGCLLASGGSDGKVCLWDLRKLKNTKTFDAESAVNSVKFDHSGLYLAVGSEKVEVLVVKAWVKVAEYSNAEKSITELNFGPLAKTVYASSLDNTIRVYE